jgi:hypothetical protein
MVVVQNSPSIASNQAFVDQVLIPGRRLIGFHAFNKGAARFVQIFDSAVSVATGAVPLRSYDIGASAGRDITFPAGFPRGFTNGILIAESTAATSYVSGSSNLFLDVQFS